MEMVAASKMKKAQEYALKTREYAERAMHILSQISHKVDKKTSPLLQERKEKGKTLIIAISSSKGLCGGLNSNVFNKVNQLEKDLEKKSTGFKYISVGKKVSQFLLKTKRELVADFSELSDVSTSFEIMPIAKVAFDEFLSEKVNEVKIIYTHFKSAISQVAVSKHIVPLNKEIMSLLLELDKDKAEKSTQKEKYDYLIEPSPKEILDNVVPSLIEAQIFQSVLESEASEHSARMMAMKNATDAAGDILDDLQLDFNQIRQSAITQEIAEIVSGTMA